MNSWIIILLLFGGFGNCGSSCCGNRSARCCDREERRSMDRDCACERREDVRRDRDRDCKWEKETGCERDSGRSDITPPGWSDYSSERRDCDCK